MHAEMALQRSEFLPVLKADDVVGVIDAFQSGFTEEMQLWQVVSKRRAGYAQRFRPRAFVRPTLARRTVAMRMTRTTIANHVCGALLAFRSGGSSSSPHG